MTICSLQFAWRVEEFSSLFAPSYGGKLKRHKLFPVLFTTNFPATSIRKKLFNSPLSSTKLSTQSRRLRKSAKTRNRTKVKIMRDIFLPFHQWTAKICRVLWRFRGVLFLPLLPLFRSTILLHSAMPRTWNEGEGISLSINQDEGEMWQQRKAFSIIRHGIFSVTKHIVSQEEGTYLIQWFIERLQWMNSSMQVFGTRRHRVV